MSYKVFISHSTNDKALALSFTEFLQLGMGLAKEEIFCSSINGTLRTGKEFIPDIKEKLTGCQVVIFLITPAYMESKFCLAELGAAWALNQNIYPLVASSLDFSCLDATPLKGIQALRMADGKGLMALYGEWIEEKIVSSKGLPAFSDYMDRFLAKLKETEASYEEEAPSQKVTAQHLQTSAYREIYPDKFGYYEARVLEARDPNLVPSHYCYRIDGFPDALPQNSGESCWLFYFKTKFPPVSVGDKVKFKFSQAKRRHFDDVGFCYNLYIDSLKTGM